MKIKKIMVVVVGIAIITIGSCKKENYNPNLNQLTSIQYEPTDSIFLNPERGFWRGIYFFPEFTEGIFDSREGGNLLGIDELKEIRKNCSLVYICVYLKSFRDCPLSDQALINLSKQMSLIRSAGLKCILRINYSNVTGEPDAPLAMILTHCEQLRPWFEENTDVIAVLQAGFIGTWGEWHTSSNGLDVPFYENIILGKLLDVLPERRMIQVRKPLYKMNFLNDSLPLNYMEAYSGKREVRIGHHNDCFLSGANDYGTYRNSYDQQYVEMESAYVPVGGETCVPLGIEPADCILAQLEMRRLHWSFLGEEYYRGTLDNWEVQGCMDDIKNNLGYRFKLLSGKYSDCVAPGGAINIELHLVNEGYASLFNPRLVEFILKNDACEYKLLTGIDPRFWEPLREVDIKLDARIPGDMREGIYHLYFNLPDPEETIYGNPDYSIRLANEDVWDSSTGYNNLLVQVKIDRNVKSSRCSGDLLFVKSGE